jgi:hypothetical protein
MLNFSVFFKFKIFLLSIVETIPKNILEKFLGAVLSPTLFSIYNNDIPVNGSKNKIHSLLFADDLIYY